MCAISMRRRRVKYLLQWNSFSNSSVCARVYVCRDLFSLDDTAKERKEKKWNISYEHENGKEI